MKHNEYIKDLVINNRIAGMTTAIVKDGKTQIDSYGFKAMEPKAEQNSEDTLYDVASLTKVLTIVPIVSKLIDSGELSFDTSVKSIFPEFKYDDVTIYDMLTHQSGLPSSVDMKGKMQNKETIINEILKLDKSYETGKNVEYSDAAYIILGLALEKVYKRPLDQIAKLEVFEPLKMNNTTYNPKDIEKCAPTEFINPDTKEVYRGIVHDWKGRLMDGIAGHAGVFSNAEDMANFMNMVLNNGYFNGKQFISEELIDMWYRNLVHETEANRTRSLCWITGDNKYVIQRGTPNIISFHGFAGPSMSLDKDNNMGICLLSNSVHPIRENKDNLNAERVNISNIIYDDYGIDNQEKNKVK